MLAPPQLPGELGEDLTRRARTGAGEAGDPAGICLRMRELVSHGRMVAPPAETLGTD